MSEPLVFAIPSKGRLMEQAAERLAEHGLKLKRVGHERGYRGEIEGVRHIDVTFVSASEVATLLRTGEAHLGITGEDLIREHMTDADTRVEFLKRFDFGHADVVVAVPAWWVDVRTMADLDDIAPAFRRAHARWVRVATKYLNLTRRFFAAHGVTDYRIVESLGATEGTPAAGTADVIVDITTTGETLRANGLKVLEDGLVLRSQASLLASAAAAWSPRAREAQNEVMARLGV